MKEYVKFANENKTSFFATVDESGQPRVRALGFWYADETGFYFQTATMKDLYKQLKNNSKAEACFFNPNDNVMMRVTGDVEFFDTKEARERVMKDRPFLRDLGLSEDSLELIMYRIAHGSAYFWTMATNLEGKKIAKF